MALYCPACERVEYHQFSMFGVGDAPCSLRCKCGFALGQLRKKGRQYEIQLLCSTGETVRMLHRARELWSAPLLALYASGIDELLGFIGNPQDVEVAVMDWDRETLDEDDFVVPDVMYEILAKLQRLAARHKILCACDRPAVGIDVYSDKVELVCAHCGSAILMNATTQQDVERVRQLAEITMKPSSYTFLDDWFKPVTGDR